MSIPNSVQSVGQFTAVISALPLSVCGVAALSLQGFKLEDTFVTADQAMDNSKVIPLVNGGAISLVNNNKAGTLTIRATHFSALITDGDLYLLALQMQSLGLSVGVNLRFTTGLQGVDDPITFYGVTIARVPPIIIMGNDVAVYDVKLNYQTWAKI